MKRVFAADLGGTKTASALVDASGGISGLRKQAAARSFEASVEQIAEAFAEASRPHAAMARPSGAGVIVPGIYEAATGRAWAPNLWGREFHPLRDALEKRLGIPVSAGSDRAASVLAEQWLGAAAGLRNVVFVAVGTGIGVGVMADGWVVEGAHGAAGAAGWMLAGVPWKPEYAACGAWESEAAGPAVARRAGMASAEAVAEAARAGDANALEALRETADHLAAGIANLIAVLDPEMVVLGGGVMQAADLMLERIRRQALGWTQPIAVASVRIEKTALGEEAGLLGAARLAWLAE
jgi:glucokinase